jgi:hypothetical protein
MEAPEPEDPEHGQFEAIKRRVFAAYVADGRPGRPEQAR